MKEEMKAQFVPYEEAVELLKMGFIAEPFKYYTRNHPTVVDGVLFNERVAPTYSTPEKSLANNYITAPLWQQAFDWIRVNYQVLGYVTPSLTGFDFCIMSSTGEGVLTSFFNRENLRHIINEPNYDKARLALLKALIAKVKEK